VAWCGVVWQAVDKEIVAILGHELVSFCTKSRNNGYMVVLTFLLSVAAFSFSHVNLDCYHNGYDL